MDPVTGLLIACGVLFSTLLMYRHAAGREAVRAAEADAALRKAEIRNAKQERELRELRETVAYLSRPAGEKIGRNMFTPREAGKCPPA